MGLRSVERRSCPKFESHELARRRPSVVRAGSGWISGDVLCDPVAVPPGARCGPRSRLRQSRRARPRCRNRDPNGPVRPPARSHVEHIERVVDELDVVHVAGRRDPRDRDPVRFGRDRPLPAQLARLRHGDRVGGVADLYRHQPAQGADRWRGHGPVAVDQASWAAVGDRDRGERDHDRVDCGRPDVHAIPASAKPSRTATVS